jgi:hypothetical protein
VAHAAAEERLMSGDEHTFRGDLAETALPQILATVHRHRVPGVVECSRSKDHKKIYFLDGDVIFATSSDREESLGEYLLMKGRISRSQLDVASREVGRFKGRRLGAILVQMGFLGAHEIALAIREQVQQIVWGLFNWNHGIVEFRAGRLSEHEGEQISISTPRVIMGGCKRIADAKLVTARLGGRNAVLERQEWPDHLSRFQLERGERTLLDLVDGRKSLYQLCEQGPLSPGINARVLYALSELGLVDRGGEPRPGHIRIQLKGTPGA